MTTDTTLICFLLDDSGSMASIRDAVISGFNEFAEAQKNAPGTAIFSLATFAEKEDFKVVHSGVEGKDFPSLHKDTYNPNGARTALYHGIISFIEDVEILEAGWTLKLGYKPPVVFIVMTDGIENASQPITKKDAFSKIDSKVKDDGWQVVYLGANQDAYAEGAGIGVKGQATQNFAATYAGVTKSMSSTSDSLLSYRSAVAAGTKNASFSYQDENDEDSQS